MKKPKLSAEEVELLREVVTKHDPSLAVLLDLLGNTPLTQEQREALRGVLADEFSATGVRADWEPNPRDLRLDDLIGQLGYF